MGPEGKKGRSEHGGEAHARRRARKTERPFDPSKRLHVALSSSRATGARSLLHPSFAGHVRRIVDRAAGRHGVVICAYVCAGNSLHLLIRTRSTRMERARPALRAFLKEISGLIARLVTGAKKGNPAVGKFWDHLAWTRVVEEGSNAARASRLFERLARQSARLLKRNGWDPPEPPF